MDRNNASNTQPIGKTNVVMQGQTDNGSFGSEYQAKSRTEEVPQDLKP